MDISTEQLDRDHDDARDWARALLQRDDWLILDTETTGIGDGTEIVQIAVCDHRGTTLLNATVKPLKSIPSDVSQIHGIDDKMVARLPTFATLYPYLRALLTGRLVVIYNSGFDREMLDQTCTLFGLDLIEFESNCAMHRYAEWCGEWNDRYDNYKWQRLPGGNHTAIGDCKATWRLISNMAEVQR